MKGSELRKIRSQLRLTQQQLADILGYHKNSVWAWENARAPIREVVARTVRELRAKGKGRP